MRIRSLGFAMLAAPAAVLAAPAGFVLELRGEWRVDGAAATLAVGSEVHTGGNLRAAKPEARPAITIVASRTGRILVARQCATARECDSPIPIPATETTGEAPGAIAALLGKVATRLRGSKALYVTTITRSESTLTDTVVELANGRLAMSAALAASAAGTYRVALRALPCAPRRECALLDLDHDFRWSPGTTAALAAPDVAPGLYELEATRVSARHLPQSDTAWVRVSTGGQHAKDAAAWESARALVASWGSSVDPAARRVFLRAVLASLGD